jgi:outer membrane lipoprotein SlyB
MKNIAFIGAASLAAAISTGCAGPEPQPYYGSQPYPPQAYQTPPPANYRVGTVDRIEVVRKGDTGNVAGTVIGGIVGGLIGHQIGHGSGNTAATIAGAAGGAVVGHEIEGRSRGPNEAFRVTVRYDNGAYQTIVRDDITDLRTGDRVRVEGGRIYRYE